MDAGRIRGPRCGIENCRSKWYEEGEDGYLYCQNGHRKGSLAVGKDESDYSTAARVRTREKQEKDEEKVYKYDRGKEGYNLYLKCLQLVLRYQTWNLIHEKGLPAELESVVFDLWALRIAQLANKISFARDDESSFENFTIESEGSQDEDEQLRHRSRAKTLQRTPSPIDCLALCYLGIVTLRLPTTPGDILDWTIDGSLPYLNAYKQIPLTMRDRVPPAFQSALQPNALFKFEWFIQVLVDLQISLTKEHGLQWPALNHPLLLFRYVKELALPLEVYEATIRLAKMLELSFTPPGDIRLNEMVGVRHIPEAQLVACLLVCVKLLYRFDNRTQYPLTGSGPASTRIDWSTWYDNISAQKKYNDAIEQYIPEQLLILQEKDVFAMSENQLDQYLDFYQDIFIDEAKNEQASDFHQGLFSMFPTDKPQTGRTSGNTLTSSYEQQRLDVVKKVQASMRPVKAAPDSAMGDELKPGQGYTLYRTEKDLPEHAKRFYEKAAKIAGLSMNMLTTAVFFMERRIERWKHDQKRRQKGATVIDESEVLQ